jgi:hypothetical protein
MLSIVVAVWQRESRTFFEPFFTGDYRHPPNVGALHAAFWQSPRPYSKIRPQLRAQRILSWLQHSKVRRCATVITVTPLSTNSRLIVSCTSWSVLASTLLLRLSHELRFIFQKRFLADHPAQGLDSCLPSPVRGERDRLPF